MFCLIFKLGASRELLAGCLSKKKNMDQCSCCVQIGKIASVRGKHACEGFSIAAKQSHSLCNSANPAIGGNMKPGSCKKNDYSPVSVLQVCIIIYWVVLPTEPLEMSQ